MERGQGKHSPRVDEELKHEEQSLIQGQGDQSSRVEEWRDPEPPADDDPDLQDPRG
ncbi:hypothetical protein ONR57_09740 [Hoyosella sp. YIM 151337]|uniref:hypothetical protein n=1 Tax=Hoyosella sp. YIM 151337 TaxID=2992742 RepID=UPI00223644D4|nr:hypothetical protein [Hoyosella sp. YIM 151337]MCW4353576.1 hypothetical protein [Hoyosella sp. YIM 151337]